MMALNAKNKAGFVEEKITKPCANDPKFTARSCNNMVWSWILKSASKGDTIKHLFHWDSWRSLERTERTCLMEWAKSFSIKKMIASHSEHNNSLAEHILSWEDYGMNWGIINQFKLYMRFSEDINWLSPGRIGLAVPKGIKKSFSHIRSQILLFDPLLQLIKFSL